jgi:plastocyanin
MARVATLLLTALALAVAGCGSSDDNGGSSSSSSSSPTPSTGSRSSSGGTAAPSAGGGSVTIKMQSIQFAPKTQAVKVGETVKWVNDDGVDHNVTADSGASFKSNDFGQGGTFSFKPTKAGTIAYECTIHPGMTGTLRVG